MKPRSEPREQRSVGCVPQGLATRIDTDGQLQPHGGQQGRGALEGQ
jgi:hypothetical protein